MFYSSNVVILNNSTKFTDANYTKKIPIEDIQYERHAATPENKH